MRNKKIVAAYLFFIVILITACKSTTYEAVYPTLSDGKYDSEFPYRNCSEQLDDLSASLAKLGVHVFYQTYSFSLESQVTMPQLRKVGNADNIPGGKDVFTETVSGTAITIQAGPKHVAYLSCAHIVDYPDTVVSYYPYPDDHYIQLIGIKVRQQNHISSLPAGNELNILAVDRQKDIAILGTELRNHSGLMLSPFPYPIGNSDELNWGSFVYIMGYPLGYAMITRGIVSSPGRISKGSFLIDATFNQGFSGGPVIAVRDGVPNFEMVGMVKSSAALNKHYIVPSSTDHLSQINFDEPYEGHVKIQAEKEIQYGITFSVTTKSLISFYKKHRKELIEQGYELDWFFIPSKN